MRWYNSNILNVQVPDEIHRATPGLHQVRKETASPLVVEWGAE